MDGKVTVFVILTIVVAIVLLEIWHNRRTEQAKFKAWEENEKERAKAGIYQGLDRTQKAIDSKLDANKSRFK